MPPTHVKVNDQLIEVARLLSKHTSNEEAATRALQLYVSRLQIEPDNAAQSCCTPEDGSPAV